MKKKHRAIDLTPCTLAFTPDGEVHVFGPKKN